MTQARTLRVVSSGICCALGYTAEATSCALRAGMDHFQESEFRTGAGQAVRVARLPDATTWGAARLAQWIRYAVTDCLAHAGVLKDRLLPLLVLAAEDGRPGAEQQQAVRAVLMEQPAWGVALQSGSKLETAGRAGLGGLLTQAHQLLSEGVAQQVMVLGFDSYLDAECINHYLNADRLLVPGNRDGFIPGEAAAAILLELAPTQTAGLHVIGWGTGMEEGRPDGSVPSRSMGMTQALRSAFEGAGVDCNDLAFRLSDQNGEGFFAGEAANAITRVALDGGTVPMVLTTADGVGEVGAATGPLMLAWLHRLLARKDRSGQCGLVHLANDDGMRCAIVVRHQD